MSHAVACKDHLLGLINEANDVHELVAVCATITTVLTHTEGLWMEATYCYKAKEIAARCVSELHCYETTCQRHKTHEMITRHIDALRTLEERYHKLQHQTMQESHNALGVRYLTNAELAS